MKKVLLLLSLIAASTFFAACENDEDKDDTTPLEGLELWFRPIVATGARDITMDSAYLYGERSIDQIEALAAYDYTITHFCLYDEKGELLRKYLVAPLSYTYDGKSQFYSTQVLGLRPGTKYYYCVLCELIDKYIYDVEDERFQPIYGNKIEFTTLPFEYGPVDLGLSVKWATANVGATTPEEAGNWYRWGEVEQWLRQANTDEGYRFYDGNSYHINKYNTQSNYGPVDNKTTLDPEDDAAHVVMGGKWRMPTKEEWQELLDTKNNPWYVWEWVTPVSPVKGSSDNERIGSGYRIAYMENDNHIFLPDVGALFGESGLLFWSSSLCSDGPSYAWRTRVYRDPFTMAVKPRTDVLTIRAVQ